MVSSPSEYASLEVRVSSPAGTRLQSFVFDPSKFASLSGSSVVNESCLWEMVLASLEAGLAAAAPGVERLDAAASLAEATRSWKVVGGREIGSTVGELNPSESSSSSSSLNDESLRYAAAASAAAAFDLRPSLPAERKLVSPASCIHLAV